LIFIVFIHNSFFVFLFRPFGAFILLGNLFSQGVALGYITLAFQAVISHAYHSGFSQGVALGYITSAFQAVISSACHSG
jgi:hypothetical protein